MSFENAVFDPTYYLLAAVTTVALTCAVVLGFRARNALTDAVARNRAFGTGLAALGASITVVGTVSMTALFRDSLLNGFLYQEAQFSVAYLGFATILYGIDVAILAGARRGPGIRAIAWVAFAVSIGASALFLFNPATYTVTHSGGSQHVAQQLIFWAPLFLVTGVGLAGVSAVASRLKDAERRKDALWFSLFLGLVLVGMLRESTIVPSSGDPLVDLLVAFVPFVGAGFSLFIGAVRLNPSKNVRAS